MSHIISIVSLGQVHTPSMAMAAGMMVLLLGATAQAGRGPVEVLK